MSEPGHNFKVGDKVQKIDANPERPPKVMGPGEVRVVTHVNNWGWISFDGMRFYSAASFKLVGAGVSSDVVTRREPEEPPTPRPTKVEVDLVLLEQISEIIDRYLTGAMADPPSWSQWDEARCKQFHAVARVHRKREDYKNPPAPSSDNPNFGIF